MTPTEQAQRARSAGRQLAQLPSGKRAELLERIAGALLERQSEILACNAEDLTEAEASAQRGELSQALVARLRLNERKLATLVEGIRSIARSDEPIGKVLRKTELAPGLILREETSPIGVLLIIFESRPDALPQIAALALRSGNGLLLKGGKEARRSNQVLHRVIVDALNPDLPEDTIGLVEGRAAVSDLLALDGVIDLIIPRGSNALVRYIQQNTRIPVLGHADGICHVYVSEHADLDMAKRIIVDSKTDYPSACNAMETLLVQRSLVEGGRAAALLQALRDASVELFGGPVASELFELPRAHELHHEYGDLQATVEVVDDLDAAVDHIHTHGSGHTESIVTSDAEEADRFLSNVDSACVFHNASTRFADGYRFGLGAEVGISTGRIHARGPVGVDGLLTTRWKLEGSGQVAADFSSGAQRFTHRRLEPDS
jgi:delta l-pyrroline-5-carboxylate synthetase